MAQPLHRQNPPRRAAHPGSRRRTAPKPSAGSPSKRIARAKRLLADPDYPPPAVIQSVARTLSRKLQDP